MVGSLKEFTQDEVAKHNKEGDLWIIVDSKVYDLSRFSDLHPGGKSVLLDEEVAGRDATDIFFSLHRHEVLLKPNYARLQIGTVSGEVEHFKPPAPDALSRVPYAEPSWLSEGYHSAYYNESHKRFQKAFRKFVREVIWPDGDALDELGKRPSQSVVDQMAAENITAMRMGPGPHLKGLTLMGGIVKSEEFDYFHELILNQEIVNAGTRGYNDGLLAGMVIALPAILNYASPELKAKVVPEVLSGKKFISLAITEAFAGSDVAGLKTTAKKTPDGKHYIVTGTKKWITTGHYSDYFVVACKTDGGLTVLFVPRTDKVQTKPIKTAYSASAGTAFVTFDGVKVPVENVLGKENQGLKVVLSNFNHERWMMCCGSVRNQRAVVEECLKWGQQRKVFGKPLLEQAVVRNKLAAMIARVESAQNWLENVTFQMTRMTYPEQAKYLAGPIGLLKMHCTQTGQETARDAVQIFGGRAITRTGMGRIIEHYHRTVAFDALLGGVEDVLGDLGVRQAIKNMPKNARL